MKKKLLALSLVMSMLMSMTACNSKETANSAPSSAPGAAQSSEAETSKAAESNEAAVEAPVEDTKLTEDDVRAMMASMSEQMKKNPAVEVETYTVAGNDVTKTFVMAFAQNNETGLSYIKFAAPVAQMEVYSEKDGHLYVDMSAEASEEEAANAENAVYFDGAKYHSLQKAEPKEGSEDITGELTESMETPADGFDGNTNFVIFNQKTVGDYTIVAIATKEKQDEPDEDAIIESKEQHTLLYVKDGAIEKFVTSASADAAELNVSGETTEATEKTEAYMIARTSGDFPAAVPDYFNDIEYSDADEVGMTAAFGMMGIMFSMMGTTGEDGEEFVPAGEWAANAGTLTMEEVEIIRELIDLDAEHLSEAAGV